MAESYRGVGTGLGFAQLRLGDLLDFTILGVLDPLVPLLRWYGRRVKELAVVELGFSARLLVLVLSLG